MSITYEEALSTLEAMFMAPWSRDTLDAVLRHEKGHMENTCERILAHGDKDPQILVNRLANGEADPQEAMDMALAQQLSAQENGGGGSGGGGGGGRSSKSITKVAAKQGRGAPTTLPDDFLRVPRFKIPANTGASAAAMDDESLARMLQDELFSEELARNPDFAHLAGRGGGGRRRTAPPAQRRAGAPPPPNPFEGVNVMDKLSEMGDNTRRRLQIIARNFELRLNANKGGDGGGRASMSENTVSVAERRGLLDDDIDDMEQIEFEDMQKKDA